MARMRDQPWNLLTARMADLRALRGAVAVLAWDHETYLPPKGGAARAEQLATLQGLQHEKLTAPDLGDAIAAAEEAERAAPDATRAALLRDHGWKVVDADDGTRVHASRFLGALPDRTFRSLEEVIAEVDESAVLVKRAPGGETASQTTLQ